MSGIALHDEDDVALDRAALPDRVHLFVRAGLDVDALKIVSEGVNSLRDANRSMLVITHYQRLLNHIVPDYVHIMASGRICRSGGKELALEVEESGYAGVDDAA